MTIQAVINMAASGELKNIAVKKDTAAIIDFINLGMIELYKRFPLKVKEHIIELQDGVEIYTMPDDFMWVVAAYDEVPEDSDEVVVPVPINEEDNPLSLNTVGWNEVQIPMSLNGAYISVIYAASPTEITVADLGSQLQLPAQMLEALLHYIGYRAHNSVTGELNAEHTTHYTRFEASCARIEASGMLTSDDMNTNKRFSTRGFV